MQPFRFSNVNQAHPAKPICITARSHARLLAFKLRADWEFAALLINGRRFSFESDNYNLPSAPPVPTTSIYLRSDGTAGGVAWRRHVVYKRPATPTRTPHPAHRTPQTLTHRPATLGWARTLVPAGPGLTGRSSLKGSSSPSNARKGWIYGLIYQDPAQARVGESSFKSSFFARCNSKPPSRRAGKV